MDSLKVQSVHDFVVQSSHRPYTYSTRVEVSHVEIKLVKYRAKLPDSAHKSELIPPAYETAD